MSEVQPGILALVGVTVGIGLLTFVIVTTTAFMKIAVVLFLVRNALGTQQIPPNMVLYGAALILTVYVSSPVAERVFERASEPHLTYATVADWIEAGRRAAEPVREHLTRFTTSEQRQFFLDATQAGGYEAVAAYCVLVLLIFVALTAVLVAVHRRLARRARRRRTT